MAKKTNELANNRIPVISGFVFTEQERALAAALGVDIDGSVDSRLSIAAGKTNEALRLVIEAGVIFLSVKSDVAHGQFLPHLVQIGVSSQRANECMAFARSMALLPADKREALMLLPKSKAMLLAGVDIEVLDDFLEAGDLTDLNGLSVRELRQRIRDLQAGHVDLSVKHDTLAAQRDGLAKQLKRRSAEAEDAHVPMVVADQRLELAALIKKAELSVNSMHPLGVKIVSLSGHDEAGVWVEPTLRLGVAGLLSLREVVDGSIKKYVEAMGESAKRLASQPDALAFLDESEVGCVATEWATLIATHQHEAALRQHERDQAKPKGKGRPKAAPEAPEAAAKARKA